MFNQYIWNSNVIFHFWLVGLHCFVIVSIFIIDKKSSHIYILKDIFWEIFLVVQHTKIIYFNIHKNPYLLCHNSLSYMYIFFDLYIQFFSLVRFCFAIFFMLSGIFFINIWMTCVWSEKIKQNIIIISIYPPQQNTKKKKIG